MEEGNPTYYYIHTCHCRTRFGLLPTYVLLSYLGTGGEQSLDRSSPPLLLFSPIGKRADG